MCLPMLWPTLAAPERHGRLRTNRNRGVRLPPRDSSAALPADLHLRRYEDAHRSAPSQADSQRTLWHLGVGRDPPGQIFQLSAHGALAGLVAVVGFGLGTGHRHRRLAATGSPAAADLRGAEEAESPGGFAPRR